MKDFQGRNNTCYLGRLLTMVLLLHINKMEFIDFCRASESALIFMKNGDNWGRIFSYVEMIAHLFPIWSDYRLLKKSSEDLYNCVKVNEVIQ